MLVIASERRVCATCKNPSPFLCMTQIPLSAAPSSDIATSACAAYLAIIEAGHRQHFRIWEYLDLFAIPALDTPKRPDKVKTADKQTVPRGA